LSGVDDQAFSWKMFAGISVFMAVIGVVYWFASYEPAGTVMLGLAAALAGLCGVYLRVEHERADSGAGHDEKQYLPHSSLWPFGIAVGALLAANGAIVGFAFAIPGVVLLMFAIAGFVAQTRRRA